MWLTHGNRRSSRAGSERSVARKADAGSASAGLGGAARAGVDVMRTAELVVLVHGTKAARLRCDRMGRLSMVYDSSYSSDSGAVQVSLSLPFQDRSHGHEDSCWLGSGYIAESVHRGDKSA